jgi:cytochrome P450
VRIDLDAAFAAWGAHDRDDPFPFYAAARARGPVHEVTLADGHHAWLVVGHDEARTLLGDPRLSKDMTAALASGCDVVAEGLPGPALAHHMLAVDPPDHTRLRRLVSAAFSVRRIERLAPRVQVVVDSLLDQIAAAGPDAVVDLVASFAFPLPFTVICELLGVPVDERVLLGHELGQLLASVDDVGYDEAKRASDAVVDMLRSLVERKRREPADDLVSALIEARDGDARLDEPELMSTIFQLIVAGHDTTTTLIGNTVVALLEHPAALDALRADLDAVPTALEEVLRYDPPVPHGTFRWATEPIEIGGVTVGATDQVIVCLASAGRDSRRWEAADDLDLARGDRQHLAFGHGIHFCLGAPLARMEADTAIRSLLARFPAMRLAVPRSELHWGHGDGLVLRGLSSLPVVLGVSRPTVPA